MRNVTLRQLRAFRAVAGGLSVGAAARALHLTQPAVSQHLKLLETEAGLPLFERMGRRLVLTPAGDHMLACARGTLDLIEGASEAFAAMRGLKRGVLKLGAVSTAKYFAPSLLSAFTPAHPGVTVKFSVGNREEMIRQTAANEVDLIIMGRPPRELRTTAVPFAQHPLVIVASPNHPLAKHRRISLRQLANEDFLIREEGSGTRASMERVFRDRNVKFRSYMEVSSNETIKQAVMAGMGISFLSAHTVGLELQTGRLVCLNVVGLPIVRDWYVVHLQHKRLSAMAEAFRSFLLREAAGIIERTVNLPFHPTRSRRYQREKAIG
jgi:DNA-binding transcriptional LysR family regulator